LRFGVWGLGQTLVVAFRYKSLKRSKLFPLRSAAVGGWGLDSGSWGLGVGVWGLVFGVWGFGVGVHRVEKEEKSKVRSG